MAFDTFRSIDLLIFVFQSAAQSCRQATTDTTYLTNRNKHFMFSKDRFATNYCVQSLAL